MHYTGMWAYQTTGTVGWDRELVLASIVIGVVFSAAALLAFRLRSLPRLIAATALLTIAICGLHFTAMGAAIVTPDPTIIVYPSFMDNATMALAVAGVTLLVMLAGIAAALIEKQTVHESVVRLHELADAAAEGIVVAKDGEIINVNQRISELSGWAGSQMFGKKVFGDLLVASRHARDALGNRPIETLMITAAGEAIPVEVIWKPYRSGLRANEVYGDQVLRMAADRMSESLGKGELVGRVGGDEFVILQSEGLQPDTAAALATRLTEAFAAPFEIDGSATDVGASIGIALYPDDGSTADQILANADMALYRAKGNGRGGACFFEPDMDLTVRRRRRLAQELRVAMAEDQFELVYHAQVRIPSAELIGFEALLRWRHPEHGVL
jgi:PAS domain S-box-containing protein